MSLFLRSYAWLAERLYNELAWAYDAVSWIVSGGKWASWRKEVLAHVTGKQVLELGFGTVLATFPSGYIFDPSTMAEVKRVPRLSDGAPGRFIMIGLYAEYRGKAFGWVPEEYLLDEDQRAGWAPGWNVRVIGPTQAKLSLPIIIFEKANEKNQLGSFG